MKYVSIIVVSFLLTACGHRQQPSPVTSDADLQKRVAGTWIYEEETGDGQYRCVVHVYRPDGSFAGEGTTVGSNKTIRVSNTGTALVRDGVLILTLTTRNGTNQVPLVARDRIVRLDDRELVLQSEDRPDLGPVTCRRER